MFLKCKFPHKYAAAKNVTANNVINRNINSKETRAIKNMFTYHDIALLVPFSIVLNYN